MKQSGKPTMQVIKQLAPTMIQFFVQHIVQDFLIYHSQLLLMQLFAKKPMKLGIFWSQRMWISMGKDIINKL